MLSRRLAIAININGQIWPGYAMDTAKNYSSVWKRSSLERQIVCQVAGDFMESHIILMANLNLVESRGHIMAMNINIESPIDPKMADDFKA